MITDRSFLHVSEVGPVRDEISLYVEIARSPISTTDSQVTAEEFPEGPRAKAVLQPGVVWGEKTRLCIARETNDQVSGGVDKFPLSGVYHRRTRPSIVPYGIEDLVRGSSVIRLAYTEPKAIEFE